MKFPNSLALTTSLVLNTMALCLLTNSAQATAPLVNKPDQIRVIEQVRHFETRSVRPVKKRLSTIRNDAIRESMIRLRELRPYTSNYRGLRRAVRRYWHNNIRRPSARRLTAVIMPYVSMWVRGIAYPKVLAHSQNGVRRVRSALRNR